MNSKDKDIVDKTNIEEKNEDDDEGIAFRKLPRGDIFRDYQNDDSPEKYDFLRARSVFRFPFTITAIKWGLVMGSLFGLHTYFKKRRIGDSVYWFCMGSVISGFPICFYTLSIRKFERDQLDQAEESNLMREYYVKKLEVTPETSDEELAKQLEKKQIQIIQKYSQIDEIEEDPELFAEFGEYRENNLENSNVKIKGI